MSDVVQAFRPARRADLKVRTTLIWVAVSMVAIVATLRAQQPPTFSGANRTVAVYATVTDAGGRLVPDLARDQFQIDDNGRKQELTIFANEIQPITVVMLLDRSTSMRGNFELVEKAAEAFVEAMLPGDKARIGSFSDRIQVDPRDFTADHGELMNILRTELQFGGPTPLWNAVNVGITDLLHQQGRRVVLVFTDGRDAPMSSERNSSLKDVMKRAEEEDVMVYAIGFAGASGFGRRSGGYGGRPGGGAGGGHGGFGGGGRTLWRRWQSRRPAGPARRRAAEDCDRHRRRLFRADVDQRPGHRRSRASPRNCTISTRSASRRPNSTARCTRWTCAWPSPA